MAFSADANRLAVGHEDGVIQAWEIDAGKAFCESMKVPADCLQELALSPDGRFLAARSSPQRLTVWDTQRALQILPSPAGGNATSVSMPATMHTPIGGLAFSPDGHWLAAAGSGDEPTLWKLENDRFVLVTSLQLDGFPCHSLAFHPSRHLLVAGAGDGMVYFYQLGMRRPIAEVQRSAASVSGLSFSPIGDSLATLSWDGSLRIWKFDASRLAQVASWGDSSPGFRPEDADPDEVIAKATEAVRQNARAAAAYLRRGVALAGIGLWDNAIRDFGMVIVLEPRNAHAYAHRARIYLTKKDYLEALNDYTAALQIAPREFHWHVNRGAARQMLGLLDQAHRDYTDAIQLAPHDPLAYYNRGLLDYGRAVERQVAAAVPSVGAPSPAELLARAIADFSEAIRLKPDEADFHLARANAYRRIGDTDKANADAARAAGLGSKLVPVGKARSG
jgi:Flp pilus assembly protein TadD